jgi:putative peptidoglycan lipid II flippase
MRAATLGIIGLGFTTIAIRALYAFEDGAGILILHSWHFVVTVVVIFAATRLLEYQHWVMISALAWSLGYWVSSLVILCRLRAKLGGIDSRKIILLFSRSVVAALISGIIGKIFLLLTRNSLAPYVFSDAFILAFIGGSLMLTTYCGALVLARCEELSILMRRVRGIIIR